jgi:NAD(P)-dependent dehydrogenase (short-subunit alcohol dehydrogenase family)
MELSDKVAVVTGAGSGIGRALSLEAARCGMRLVLADRNAAAADAVREELAASGVSALSVATDVADPDAVQDLCDRAYAHFGAVHLLVNNAGLAVVGAAWRTSLEDYRRTIDVNLYGVIHGLRAFVPAMLASGEPGHIVNVASAAGLFTLPGLAAYSASKFAVAGLTEALHHDLVQRAANIGVSLLCPSWVRTSIGGPAGDFDAHEAKSAAEIGQAIRSGVAAEDVAQAVLEAVRTGTFYVLTHPTTGIALRVRTDDILKTRPPTLFSIG